jgi:hypothetical protein
MSLSQFSVQKGRTVLLVFRLEPLARRPTTALLDLMHPIRVPPGTLVATLQAFRFASLDTDAHWEVMPTSTRVVLLVNTAPLGPPPNKHVQLDSIVGSASADNALRTLQ